MRTGFGIQKDKADVYYDDETKDERTSKGRPRKRKDVRVEKKSAEKRKRRKASFY